MARPLRIERVGGWYHITSRGNERRPIFRDDRDRQHFCDLLADLTAQFAVRLHAFVLMDNHYHLLLELTEPNLSRAIQWLNVSYSVWFNRRHDRSGHLFQGRFKSIVVSPQEWGLELSRYIHLNPVRTKSLGLAKDQRQRARVPSSAPPAAAVITERLARLRAHRWSSYRAYAGWAKPPAWLQYQSVLDLGGGKKKDQTRAYRDYVEAALREGSLTSPWQHLQEQIVLGGQEFLRRLRPELKGNARDQGPLRHLTVQRINFDEIVARLEHIRKERWADFRDRHGDRGRDLALYAARRLTPLSLRELAALAGMNDYTSVALAVKRLGSRLKTEPSLRHQLQQLCQISNVEI